LGERLSPSFVIENGKVFSHPRLANPFSRAKRRKIKEIGKGDVESEAE
jgi:hypothetical protein